MIDTKRKCNICLEKIRLRKRHVLIFAFLSVAIAVRPLQGEASFTSLWKGLFRYSKKSSVETVQYRELNLRDAIRLALDNNVAMKLASEGVREAKGERLQTASDLLPHVEASIYQQRTFKLNLAAMGFKGFNMIGPFNTFDARFRLTQKIFDLSAISRFQAGNAAVKIKRYEEDFERQKVILEASLAYLGSLQSTGVYQAAKANKKLANRLFIQAKHQHEVQVATGVDVARSETRMAEEKLHLEEARMGLTESYFHLQRVVGISFAERLSLSDSLFLLEEPEMSLETAIAMAEDKRLEMQILKDKIRAANHLLRAAKAEVLPKFVMQGDYGLSGIKPNKTARETGEILFGLSMPILEGGNIVGAVKKAASRKRQLERQMEDLKRQIEEDVRLALLKIKTECEQVKTARSVLALARRELKMSRDRFKSGLGDNVEVTDAQTTLARARFTHVTALTKYHVARLNLYFALGKANEFYLQDKKIKKE